MKIAEKSGFVLHYGGVFTAEANPQGIGDVLFDRFHFVIDCRLNVGGQWASMRPETWLRMLGAIDAHHTSAKIKARHEFWQRTFMEAQDIETLKGQLNYHVII